LQTGAEPDASAANLGVGGDIPLSSGAVTSSAASPASPLGAPLDAAGESGSVEPETTGTHTGSSLEVHSLFQRFKDQVEAFGAFISAEEHAVIDGLKSKILGE
jgi:hypothetical protein